MSQKRQLEKELLEFFERNEKGIDVGSFQSITSLLRSNLMLCKEFMNWTKLKLTSDRRERSQLVLLELVEYVSCQEITPVTAELNSTSFTQILTSTINHKSTSKSVESKIAYLGQLWAHSLSAKRDLYPNIVSFGNQLTKNGLQLPAYTPSPYLAHHHSSHHRGTPNPPDDDSKEMLLFKELSNIKTTLLNSRKMIDENDPRFSEQNVENLLSILNKLENLDDFLMDRNLTQLFQFSSQLKEEINDILKQYQNRNNRGISGQLNRQNTNPDFLDIGEKDAFGVSGRSQFPINNTDRNTAQMTTDQESGDPFSVFSRQSTDQTNHLLTFKTKEVVPTNSFAQSVDFHALPVKNNDDFDSLFTNSSKDKQREISKELLGNPLTPFDSFGLKNSKNTIETNPNIDFIGINCGDKNKISSASSRLNSKTDDLICYEKKIESQNPVHDPFKFLPNSFRQNDFVG